MGGQAELSQRLDRIEAMLNRLVLCGSVREWYTTSEVAAMVDKSQFTVREWCRQGRIHAEKRQSGRGAHPAWVISHAELERYRREGLLPRKC